jgi:hypothetical protein
MAGQDMAGQDMTAKAPAPGVVSVAGLPEGAALVSAVIGGRLVVLAEGRLYSQTATGWQPLAGDAVPGAQPLLGTGGPRLYQIASETRICRIEVAEGRVSLHDCASPGETPGETIVHLAVAGLGAEDRPVVALATGAGGWRFALAGSPLAESWDDLPAMAGDAPEIADLFAVGSRLIAVSEEVLGLSAWILDLTSPETIAEGWVRRLEQGAWRYGMNRHLTAAVLDPVRAEIFVALGAARSAPLSGLEPPGAEILRLAPTAGWDLVMGETRLSPEGLKVPESLLGQGFERAELPDITALALAGGHLYALCEGAPGAAPLLQQSAAGPDVADWTPIDLPPCPRGFLQSALHVLDGALIVVGQDGIWSLQ